jgi:hypothetical protein
MMVKRSVVTVQPGESMQQCRPQGSKQHSVQLQANMDHNALIAALAHHRSSRVLKFSDMRHAYGAFPSDAHMRRCHSYPCSMQSHKCSLSFAPRENWIGLIQCCLCGCWLTC